MSTQSPPRSLFKICTAAERSSFDASGHVLSQLDRDVGFCHLSDRSQAPKVAGLFFKGATDLMIIEVDAEKLPGPLKWVTGAMGDPPLSGASANPASGTVGHYLLPDGCVHIYGSTGVPAAAIVREASLPLGADGNHVFPDWVLSNDARAAPRAWQDLPLWFWRFGFAVVGVAAAVGVVSALVNGEAHSTNKSPPPKGMLNIAALAGPGAAAGKAVAKAAAAGAAGGKACDN